MRLRRALALALFATVIVGLPTLSVADEHEDDTAAPVPLPEFFDGIRASGAGGSHTAVASGVDALYQNPAGIARAPMYVIDGAFTHTPQGAILSAGVSDSKLNPQFALALGYNYFIGRGDHEHLSGHDARLALGIPVIPEQISFGGGVRYLRITDDTLPVEDEEDPQLLIHGVTFDAGINFRVAEMLHLGLKGENLLDLCADDEACRGATPTRITAGAGVGRETEFMISAEAGIDLTSGPGPLFDFGVGGEYLIAGIVPIRAGFQRRAFLDRNLITFGAAWRSEQAGVDFSYRHDLNAANEFGYVSAGFSIYF